MTETATTTKVPSPRRDRRHTVCICEPEHCDEDCGYCRRHSVCAGVPA